MSERSEAPGARDLAAALRDRCTFPDPGTPYPCAFSGGPDSTALLALAAGTGLDVVAHHADHGLRASSKDEAEQARAIASRLGVPFHLARLALEPGPNIEARARAARATAFPAGIATGHTLDDQAETVLVNLLRGAGAAGLAAMRPSVQKPLLAVRRHETEALCAALGIDVVRDPTNAEPGIRRNRIRHELLPLAADIAGRDPAPLLARTADVCRQDDELLESLASCVDPTDCAALRAQPRAVASRALRRWLADGGYPPSHASLERVLAVVDGARLACELPGGIRIARSGQRLRRSTTSAQ